MKDQDLKILLEQVCAQITTMEVVDLCEVFAMLGLETELNEVDV